MAECICQARGLGFAFDRGGPAVLREVDLALPPACFGGLLGPNGSGKSTLLRCLLGRLRPTAGEVLLRGQPISAVRPEQRARQLGYLPQEVHAAYSFSVLQVVLLGRFPHLGFGLETDRDLAVAEDCLRRTDTLQLAERNFQTLSGGEKQRVLLASVLAQEPAVMLLDEPTAALDIHHQHEVLELLAGFCAEGLAVLMVTHDLNLAARWCDRLWMLHHGRIVREGTAADVLTDDLLSKVYNERLRLGTDPDLGGPLVLPPLPRASHA